MAESGAIILDTPEQIAAARVAVLANSLAFEINTGMKMSNRFSTVKLANSYGFPGKQKKAALKWLVHAFDLNETEPIKKALA